MANEFGCDCEPTTRTACSAYFWYSDDAPCQSTPRDSPRSTATSIAGSRRTPAMTEKKTYIRSSFHTL
jgi:hypothetical protein